MDFEKAWNTALHQTEIIRARIAALQTGRDTRVPYVLLAESSVNAGDTVVRKGEVIVDKPALLLPPNNPQLKGFDLGDLGSFNEASMINYLLVRGVTLPSFNYDNKTHSLNIYEGDLSSAIKFYNKELQHQENVYTGLIKGSEEYWQFSILIFICSQVARNADTDIRKLLERYKKGLS